MAFDTHPNFAYSTVATAPSPASSGTSLVVASGDGTLFATTPPFNAVIWPAGAQPTTTNAEIVRITNLSTDTLTITRTQESTSARTVVVGDQIAVVATKKVFTDIEAAAPNGAWTSYSPSWTSTGSAPSIGNGTITGAYQQNGKLVHYRVVITAGSTTTFGTGSYRVSLPTTANETPAGVQVPMGTWGAFHASNNYGGFSGLVSTTTVGGLLPSLSTSGLFGAELTNTAPSTWVNGDTLNFKGFYEST